MRAFTRRLFAAPLAALTLLTPMSGSTFDVARWDAPLTALAVERANTPGRYGAYATADGMRRITAAGRLAGVRVKWTLDGCPPDHGRRRTHGRYCVDAPDVVWLNSEEPRFAMRLREGYVDSTLRHELAHRAMLLACGTLDPPAAHGRVEAVASAYAVRFYGADHDQLEEGHAAEYRMADADYAAAQRVHDGRCG